MNCDVVYGLVPRAPIDMIIHNRANQVAQRMTTEVARGMDLEGQTTTDSDRAATTEALRERLIATAAR